MATDTTFDALLETEPLSQVVFIHDYLQLVFQDWTLTINPIEGVTVGARRVGWGQSGFSDALTALIGRRVADTSVERNSFVIRFDDGTNVEISLDEAYAAGPEIMQLDNRSGSSFVWRYGE